MKGVLERAGRSVRKQLYQFRQDSWDPETGRDVRIREQELTRDASRENCQDLELYLNTLQCSLLLMKFPTSGSPLEILAKTQAGL